MSSVVLNGATSGSTTITPTDAVTVTCTLPSTGGTLQTSGSGYTTNGVAYASSTSALSTGSAFQFDGTKVIAQGVNFAYYTGLYANDGTISNYSSSNGVYLNGNANGFLTLAGDGSRYSFVRVFGASASTPNLITFNTNNAEAMRIKSTGDIKIVAGNLLGWSDYSAGSTGVGITATSENLLFYSSGSERARIDSSGNVLVAKTAISNTTVGVEARTIGNVWSTMADSTSANSTWNTYSTSASAYRFYVDMAGTIHATSTTITAISDASLKTNIKPLETGLAQVLALQPRRFDWTEESKNEARNVAGFIAQEVEQVLPDLVAPFKYNETETKLGLKMGDMIPTLVKAIQELNTLVTTQAETITSMQATITALQTKVGV